MTQRGDDHARNECSRVAGGKMGQTGATTLGTMLMLICINGDDRSSRPFSHNHGPYDIEALSAPDSYEGIDSKTGGVLLHRTHSVDFAKREDRAHTEFSVAWLFTS